MRELIRPDILYTILLDNFEYIMNWIIGFLELYRRLHVFDNTWVMMEPYLGNPLPPKAYRQLT